MARPFYSAPSECRLVPPLPLGQPRLSTPAPPPVHPPGFSSDKPWMTPHLVSEIRRRNYLQNQAARSHSEQDRAAAEQQRLLVNKLVTEAKERFCLAHPERTDEILSSDRRARPFHCGSCDRSYGSQQLLDEHCREHVRCGLDDCPFTAHPRVVEKHVTMQHQTGLAKVIMALNTPEAIARWREQRRANFCRPETAARRQAEQEQRVARGVRLPDRGGRFPPPQERSGRGRGRGRGDRGRGRGRGGRGYRPPGLPRPPGSDSDEDEEEAPRGLTPFAGILAAPDFDDSETVENSEDCTTAAEGEDGTTVNGLSATKEGEDRTSVGDEDQPTAVDEGIVSVKGDGDLASAEGDGDARVDGKGDNCASTEADKDAVTTDGENTTMECDDSAADVKGSESDRAAVKEGEDLATVKCEDPSTAEDGDRGGDDSMVAQDGRQRGRGRGGGRGGRGGWRGRGRGRGQDHPPRGSGQPPRKRRRPLTLLEKLLANDIRRERNILLQCVRYVVNENFFDNRPLGPARPAPAAETVVTKQEPTDSGTKQPAPADEGRTEETSATAVVKTEEPSPSSAADGGEEEEEVVTAPRLLGGAYYDSDAITDSD